MNALSVVPAKAGPSADVRNGKVQLDSRVRGNERSVRGTGTESARSAVRRPLILPLFPATCA